MKNINDFKTMSSIQRLEEKSKLREKIKKTEAKMEAVKLFGKLVAFATSLYEAFVGLGKVAVFGTISIGVLDATAIFTFLGSFCLVAGILVYRFLAIKLAEYQTDFENLSDAEILAEKEIELIANKKNVKKKKK